MEYLSQLYMPGALTLWCALIFALAAIWGYAQLLWGDPSARAFARRAYSFFAYSIVLSGLVLGISLLRRDFRIEYVHQYSGLDLPAHFQFAAFWAGQKGSFLIWLVFGALIGIPVARSAGARREAPVMCLYILVQLGLLFILLRENPFVMLAEAPLDGKGLNPLLQDDWMVIHPPVMFVGYASAAIPFCFAIAALWRRDYEGWAVRAFPWALFGFMVLGCAILMGGYWAYKTLGWGGFWGWDPVENASLIPWLLGTILIHGLYLERTQGRYRRANIVIAFLTFMSVLYGTFLTRSGVLADFSVHSFVDLGISGWLVALMAFFGLGGLLLILLRLREVPTEQNEDPLLSRGTFLMASTIVVGLSAVLVAVGTSAPLLTRFMEDPGQVGPEFYNRVHMPLALAIALLLGMVPYLTWKGVPRDGLLRRVLPSLIAAIVITLGAAIAAVRDPFHLIFVFLAALAVAANFQKTLDKLRAGGLKHAGGYLAHVGVGMILLGVIASSAYDRSAKVTLKKGETQQVGDLSLTFNRFLNRGEAVEECGRRECMEIQVVEASGRTYNAYPKMFLNDRTRQLMVNPDIQSYLGKDLYISPIEYNPGTPEGVDRQALLGRGESIDIGDVTVRFVDFDLSGTNAAASQRAGMVSVGAALEVIRDGQVQRVVPQYRLNPGGFIETPPAQVPGGGQVVFASLNTAQEKALIQMSGLAPGIEREPAILAIDLTQKPLIKLVWWGLYVVLAGGALAGVHRARQAFTIERLEAEGKISG